MAAEAAGNLEKDSERIPQPGANFYPFFFGGDSVPLLKSTTENGSLILTSLLEDPVEG